MKAADGLFPERYRDGAHVAFRGSWNRSRGIGYKIVYVPFGEDDRPEADYEDFVTRLLLAPSVPTTWGPTARENFRRRGGRARRPGLSQRYAAR